MAKNIDKLIINSPYQEPKQYWPYDRENRNFNIKVKIVSKTKQNENT